MSSHSIKMPDVGEGVTEAEIVTWHVKVGDVVEEDDDLVDVMTDKATVEIPSPVSGTIVSVSGAPGEMIPVGSPFITIETEGAASTEAPPKAPEAPVSMPETVEAPAQTNAPTPVATAPPPHTPMPAPIQPMKNGRALASPAVRQRALELDVDLSQVSGSGPAGRVLRDDLEDFIASGGRAVARSGGGSALHPLTGVTETKIIGLRRKIAQNMERSLSVPMITYVEEIDVTELEALRKTLNARKRDDQTKLTLLPFLAMALIKALRKVPHANAHYLPEEETLSEYEGVHLGVATATDKGLVVPVLRHAEAIDIWTLAAEVKRLSEAARTGKASREELTGSTITITSLGAIGGVVTTPILNPPETSIIGVNKMMERPAFDGQGHVIPRLYMNLSSSFDHRIVDGYECAILIQAIREYLETPATLFIPES